MVWSHDLRAAAVCTKILNEFFQYVLMRVFFPQKIELIKNQIINT